MSRAALLAQIRADCKGDLYVAFTSCLKQLIDGKMEASTYEDAMRTLLGTNAYLLFTLHKIIAQALKQLQMILVEETSQKLMDLYQYERQRASAGAFCEATYRSNARMVLEGDDCFRMEQLYSSGDPKSFGEGNAGGALVLAFLPEKEEDDDEDVEEEDDDDDDDGDEAGKAETVAYMRSFMQRARSIASLPKSNGRGALLLKRKLRSPRKPLWTKALLSNGLECRSTVGSCKLRFVSRSRTCGSWRPPAAPSLRAARRSAPAAAAAAAANGGSWRARWRAGLQGRAQRTLGAGQRQGGAAAQAARVSRCRQRRRPLPLARADEAIDRWHAGAWFGGRGRDAAGFRAQRLPLGAK